MLNFTLPYPPSVNDYYGRGASHVYVKPSVRAYRLKVREIVLRLPPSALAAFQRGPLAMRVVLNPPTGQTAQDVDNGNKGLLDALTRAGVWKDDKQVKTQLNVTGEPVEGGSVTVTIEKLENVAVYFDYTERAHVA